MENTVKHDWFATRLMNGDKDLTNLIADDIVPANSTLESPEFYKEKNKVKEIFTDDNGNFDDEKFNNFYNQMKLEYDYLKAIDTENYIYDMYQKSNADFTTDFGKAKDREMTVSQIANPQEQKYGIGQWNTWSDPELSKREAAQKNYYYNTETGQWSDKTVNELGALGLITGDSLVYATWDTDGTHVDPLSGETVRHAKGDWKTDEWGNYYTETAGNKENLDKQFVTISEVLTDDEGAWNTIDIFDSDDINQNIPKTIARAAVTVAAMMTPWGSIGKTISLLTAAMQFARVMPQIGKTLTSFFNEDTEFDKLNSWDNYMRKFKRSTSDYSQEHSFSFESIMDMAISSFTQYAQQRAIAQIPQMFYGKAIDDSYAEATIKELFKHNGETQVFLLQNREVLNEVVKAGAGYRKTKELLDKAEKISTAVSRGYLIATSTEDVYREARNYGFDKQTSSVISLATYLGVWSLFSTDYFRGLLYNGSDYETKKKVDLLVKSYLKNNAAKMAKDVVGANNETKKAVYKQWISSIGSFIKNHIAEVNAGEFGIMAGAVGEGLEEISEEVAQDLAFQIGQGWNKIKTLYTGEEYTTDYAYTKTNPLMRYATAGFGGALGGAIFKTADRLVYNKSAYKNWKEMLGNNDLAMKELVYYVSQGKTNQILASIDNLKKQSPLLSTDTSIFDGKKTSNVDETENEVLFSTFRKAIISLDTFINTNNLNIDREVFADIDLGHGVKAAIINAKGLQDSMFNDYQRRLERLADLNGQLEDLQAKNIPSLDDTAKADIASKITEVKKSIKEELDGVKRLINGEDDTYLGKLLLETNDHLRAAFINDKNALAQKYYNLNYEDLPEAYKQAVDTIYDRRVKSGSLELEYDKAWQLYSGLASDESLRNILQGIQGNYRSFNFDLTETADLNMARLDAEKGITNEDVVDELFKILKINSPDNLPDNILRTIALSLLGIKSSPDIDLDVSDYDTIAQLAPNLLIGIADTIEEYFSEIEAAYNEYVQNYQNEQFNMTDDVKYVGNRYASLDTIRAVKDIVTSIDLEPFLNGFGDFNINIVTSPINNLLQHIIDNKKSFKGIDISIVAELLNKLQQLGKDFVLSDTNVQQLTEILDLVTVALSIVRSAYDEYASRLNGVPFGANNFMNSVFAEKKINKEFVQLNKDQVIGWILELENFKHKIQNILDTGLANKKSIISEEKRLSLQYDQKRLTVIKSFLENAPSYIKDGILIDLDDIVIDINSLTEEQFIEVSAKYRNLLLSFERQFKDNWNNFDISTKEDLISKIEAFSRKNTKDKHLHGDTSTLVLDKISFTGTDFYYYLLGISISNTDLVNQLYRNYYDSIKDKVPFDSQEAVIVNALRFLTRDNNLEIWLKPIQSDIDNAPNGSDTKFIHVCKNIIKILCKGGTGKSSTIIPGIYQSFCSHDTATKWIFAANTDDQLATLKQSIDDKSQTYCLVSSLINNLKDPTKRDQYKDAIIVIDEATNIELDTWKELDEIGNQLNITFIAVGDDTQVGKPRNIDYLSGYQTPSLSETFRATSDINRFNTRTWDQIDFTSTSTLTPSPNAYFMYYEDDHTFDGIKFENQDLTVEYVVEFIEKYITNKSQRLLLFTDKDILSKLPKEIAESCIITSTTDYSRIQGAEWNYVLTDVDLSFDGDNTDQYKIRHRQNYTIFSRAKQGVVSFKPLVYKIGDAEWIAKSVASKTKPIYTALTPDIVESFKKFKDAVHELVKLNTSPKASSKPAPKPVTVNTPVNSSIVQVSPAFVKQDENIAKLNISAQDLPNIRATLYLLATTNDEDYKKRLIKQLPQRLQNGEFMLTFVDANTDEFSTLGNVFRDDKNVVGIHPMLVYAVPINGEYVDIYLGMFHSPNNSKHIATTNATSVVWSLIEGMEEKDARNARFRIPNITITRSTNPIAIQNNESKKDLQLTYENGILKPEASTFTMSSTPVVYFSSKQDSRFSHTADIIKASDELRTRYADLWKLISKKIPKQYLPLFADVIGYDRKTKKYKAKGFSTLNKKFISFVQIGNSNLNSVKGLQEASSKYLGQLEDRIAHVNQLIDVLNQFNNIDDILRNCQAILSNRGIWNTSVIVYSPTTTKDKGEIKQILNDLFKNEDDKYYDEAIESQINMLVGRIGHGYETGDETICKFVDDLKIDTEILKSVWKDCILGNTSEFNGNYYWQHDQIQKLIVEAYAGGLDIEWLNTLTYDKLPLQGHLYLGLLVKNSLPVINPTKDSAITTTGTFTVEGSKKVIQPAQIYVFVDDSVTSDNAKNVFIPIANTPSPFVDPTPVPIADSTSTPIVDPKPAQIADPKDDNETKSAKGTRIITELRKNFGVPITTSIDSRNRDYIGNLSKEIIDLLLQLQEPTTNEAIDANNNIINEIKIKNVSTFPATMRVLVNILGKKKFPYNNKGNICK